MALTKAQTNDVCCLDEDNQCLYLSEEFNEKETDIIHVCLKLTKSKQKLDSEYSIANGESYNGGNCSGYLKLYNIKQGYDVD